MRYQRHTPTDCVLPLEARTFQPDFHPTHPRDDERDVFAFGGVLADDPHTIARQHLHMHVGDEELGESRADGIHGRPLAVLRAPFCHSYDTTQLTFETLNHSTSLRQLAAALYYKIGLIGSLLDVVSALFLCAAHNLIVHRLIHRGSYAG